MDETLLSLKQVLEVTSLSRSGVYLKLSEGTFPKPIHLGVRRIAWRRSDIQDWIKSL